ENVSENVGTFRPISRGNMTEHCFEIRQEEEGSRVDEYLAKRFPLLSRTKLRGLVAVGAASRSGKVLSIGQRLRALDVVQFHWDPKRVPCCFPEPMKLEVLWEDRFLMVVNKPAGILAHPTRGVKRGTLTNGLLAYLNPDLTQTEVVPEG